MRLLVDAMNVLHAWRSGPAEGKAIDIAALARAVSRSRYAGDEAILVVDGTPPPEASLSPDGRFEAAGCAVVFSGPGAEADDVIEAILERPGPVRETVVVSADRRLGRAARRRGARSMGASTFVGVLMEDGAGWARGEPAPGADAPGRGPAGLLESGEVEAWLAAFGVDGPGAAPAPDSDASTPDTPPPPPGATPGAGRRPPEGAWDAELDREWPGLRDEDLDMDQWLGEAD